MKKIPIYLSVILLVAVLTMPLNVDTYSLPVSQLQAQINALLEQVNKLQQQLSNRNNVVVSQPPSSPVSLSICPKITHNLSYGGYGSDVVELQNFLINSNLLSRGLNTGWFGPATQNAVQRFQSMYNVVDWGNPYLTGYGVVGPATRNTILNKCISVKPVCPPVLGMPYCHNGAVVSNGVDANGCSLGYKCEQYACKQMYDPVCGQKQFSCPPGALCPMMMPMPKTYANTCEMKRAGATLIHPGKCEDDVVNKSPIISSVSGPTVLKIGERGVWSIVASDPENQSLRYDISWGDEPRIVYDVAKMSVSAAEYRQESAFEHIYNHAGTFTITITVSDNVGNTIKTTRTVRVSGQKNYTSRINNVWVSRNHVKQGEQITISWDSYSTHPDAHVRLELRHVNGNGVNESGIVNRLSAQGGSYTWTIPTADGPCMADGGTTCGAAIKPGEQYIIRALMYTPSDYCWGYCMAQPDRKILTQKDSGSFVINAGYSTVITDMCRSWTDGCNSCSRELPGAPAMCTLRACVWQGVAQCYSYF